MPGRAPRPHRDDYAVWRLATTRWADDDVHGHMNDARCLGLIDTAVDAHLAEATGVDIRTLPAVGVVAEVGCRCFHEIGYPRPVDLGLVVDRGGHILGPYRIGLFQGDPDGEGRSRRRRGAWCSYVDDTGGSSQGRRGGAACVRCRTWGGPPWCPCGATPATDLFDWSCSTTSPLFLLEGAPLGPIVVVLLLALVLAAAVMLYAAYPYRGEETPVVPLVGQVLRRGVDSLPTLAQEQQNRPAVRREPVAAGVDAHR